MKNTSAASYFNALGRSAFSRGFPILAGRVQRQSWPRFAQSAYAAGWLMQGSTNLKKAIK
jgi:hypothetical protein